MDEAALPRPAELAALLAAKLCHDLISPTSAIVSGVDLIEDPESQDMREDALALVISSSRKLGALLQFCRVAFGASASADTFDVRDLQKLAEGYFETQKAALVWAVGPESVGKPAARALLNLAQLGAGALPRGGEARLSVDEAGGLTIVMTASGTRAVLRPEVARGLAGEPMGEGMSGYWIQAYYLSLIVADAGGTISAEAGEDRAAITVILPG
ncbi:MAG: histidine phosphotransferase family protein [Alphaproteobacteria bacterium]